MSNIKEIFLHIGMQKTGTTSIQDTMIQNIKILANNGYMYPKNWTANHSFVIGSVFEDNPEKFHVNIIKGYTINQIKELNEKYINDLKQEISNTKCSKLIISGEIISDMKPENLIKLKNTLTEITNKDVKFNIILYVRNHIKWAISIYQQRIKGFGDSHSKAFEMVKRIMKNLYKNRVFKFEKIFGKESIFIYNFEKSINSTYGIVGDFLNNIGFTELSKIKYIKSNESISIVASDILAYINEKLPMIHDGKINENRFVGDINPILNIKGPKVDLHYIDKNKLLEICNEDIVWLKNNYNIDYSKKELYRDIYYNFNNEIINDIKIAYNNLPDLLKPLLIEFVKQKALFVSNLDRIVLYDLLQLLR